MIYEIVLSCFMLAVGVWGSFYTRTFRKPNAKWMPLIAFGIMILFSLIVLVNAFIKYRKKGSVVVKKTEATAPEENKDTWLSKHPYLVTAIKLGIILFFFVSFKVVNFFITMPLAILAVGFLSDIHWKKVVPTAIIATLVTYGVFIMWLNVYMG